MSDTKITYRLGGEVREFDLNFNNALIFEREQRKSLYETFQDFLANRWRMRDALEIIRLGLIGAGMDEIDAFELAESMKERPIGLSATLATKILEAAFFGKATAEREEIDRVLGAE